MQTRTPFAKLSKQQLQKRGVKRPHDDDVPRREFFAGLIAADKENKRTAAQHMAVANDHYRKQKRARISLETAQRWKRQCLFDLEKFTAGPAYSHEGNKRLTDDEVRAARVCCFLLIFR